MTDNTVLERTEIAIQRHEPDAETDEWWDAPVPEFSYSSVPEAIEIARARKSRIPDERYSRHRVIEKKTYCTVVWEG